MLLDTSLVHTGQEFLTFEQNEHTGRSRGPSFQVAGQAFADFDPGSAGYSACGV
jgi:hypothetical protein